MTAARRRRAAARRRAGQGDGLQRRAQAPEDRGSRATCTGPTGWGSWSGRRCRAPTASPARRWSGSPAVDRGRCSRDRSHPCIVAWVPFNESWGVPDLPAIPAQRHYVQALYHLTKTLDPTPAGGRQRRLGERRPPTSSASTTTTTTRSAWPAGTRGPTCCPQLFRHGRPGGRLLTLEGHPHAGQPIMLTEFGGIAIGGRVRGHVGLLALRDAGGVRRDVPPAARGGALARSCWRGFCYTQFADTYQESNGLLYADRTPKFPLEEIAAATRGR